MFNWNEVPTLEFYLAHKSHHGRIEFFVAQSRHPLRNALQAAINEQFSRNLRAYLNPVTSVVKQFHSITTGKYTVKH